MRRVRVLRSGPVLVNTPPSALFGSRRNSFPTIPSIAPLYPLEDKKQSAQFEVYRMLFVQVTVRDRLQEILPHNFNLSIVSDIFTSWKKSSPPIPEADLMKLVNVAARHPVSHIYENDKMYYRSTVWVTKESGNPQAHATDGVIYTLHVILSNNGFFCPDESSLKTHRSGMTRREDKTPAHTWCTLKWDEFEHFQALYDFSTEWLGLRKPKVIMLYNETCERTEFKAFNDTAGLQVYIALEPGHPEVELTEDLWLQEKD